MSRGLLVVLLAAALAESEAGNSSLSSTVDAGKAKLALVSREAPLSEEGYAKVAALRSDAAMRMYVLRVLKALGRRVVSEGGLNGFVPHYSGAVASQSFARLRDELRSADWTSTVRVRQLKQRALERNRAGSNGTSKTVDNSDVAADQASGASKRNRTASSPPQVVANSSRELPSSSIETLRATRPQGKAARGAKKLQLQKSSASAPEETPIATSPEVQAFLNAVKHVNGENPMSVLAKETPAEASPEAQGTQGVAERVSLEAVRSADGTLALLGQAHPPHASELAEKTARNQEAASRNTQLAAEIAAMEKETRSLQSQAEEYLQAAHQLDDVAQGLDDDVLLGSFESTRSILTNLVLSSQDDRSAASSSKVSLLAVAGPAGKSVAGAEATEARVLSTGDGLDIQYRSLLRKHAHMTAHRQELLALEEKLVQTSSQLQGLEARLFGVS